MTMLNETKVFYRKTDGKEARIGKKCNSVQSMALKENCYDYTLTLVTLMESLVNRVELDDFKFVLA